MLGGRLEWPATPDLAPAITRRRIALARRPWFESRWAMAAAAGDPRAGRACSPTRPAAKRSRTGSTFTRSSRGTLTCRRRRRCRPDRWAQRLGLGGQTTLPEAEQRWHWQVLFPPSLGPPDEVYLQQPPDGPSRGEVTLVYAHATGNPRSSGQTGVAVLVTEARGAVDQQFFGKMLGPRHHDGAGDGRRAPGTGSRARRTTSSSSTRTATLAHETLRLATNTLILDDGGTIVRIEGDLTKDQALEHRRLARLREPAPRPAVYGRRGEEHASLLCATVRRLWW